MLMFTIYIEWGVEMLLDFSVENYKLKVSQFYGLYL